MNRNIKSDTRNDEDVHLLWTGGWDSTFRLLTLLIEQRKRTQPYYIIDPARRSTRMELLAMHRIKKCLLQKYTDVNNHLLPTIFVAVEDIPPNIRISECYQRMCAEHSIGIQYDWLSRFAHHRGLADLEMGYEKTVDVNDDWIAPYLVQQGSAADPFYKVNIKYVESDLFEVFKNFKFPVAGLTKRDMQIICKSKGYAEIMNLTWFCHRPRSNGKPCGVCSPCEQAIKNGTPWRLPFASRCKYHVQKPLKRATKILQTRCPIVYRNAQWVKHNILRDST